MRILRFALAAVPACRLRVCGFARQDPTSTQSVSACTDFNQYANGRLVQEEPDPAGVFVLGRRQRARRAQTARSFARSSRRPRRATPWPGRNDRKLARLLHELHERDLSPIEQGLKPLQPELDRIAAIKNAGELQAEIAHLLRQRLQSAVSASDRRQDKKNKRGCVLPEARQGGLGLRPIATTTSSRIRNRKRSREEYAKYVRKLFELAGDTPKPRLMSGYEVIALETKLAGASLTRVQRRDPELTYHRMTLKEASELTPTFRLRPSITPRSAHQPMRRSTSHPSISSRRSTKTSPSSRFPTGRAISASTPSIRCAPPALSKNFVDASFAFFSTTLRGVKEQLPRLESRLRRRHRSRPWASPRAGVC